jgi:[protein-PII] uridylyltransferase
MLAFLESGAIARVEPFRDAAPSAPSWGIVVLARDRDGLFATVAGVLSGCGHNILAASAYTSRDGIALDLFHVDPIAGGAAEQELERERIERRLAAVLEGSAAIPAPPQRAPLPRALRVLPSSARIENDESDFYTIVDVETMDRPGLLYDIARTLSDQGLSIVAVRASTRASRASDAFYVTGADDLKLTDPARMAAVEAAILAAIEPAAASAPPPVVAPTA